MKINDKLKASIIFWIITSIFLGLVWWMIKASQCSKECNVRCAPHPVVGTNGDACICDVTRVLR